MNPLLQTSIYNKHLIFYVSSTKSEQGWLRINRSRNIDTGLLWEAAVCGNCTQEVDNKIFETPVP